MVILNGCGDKEGCVFERPRHVILATTFVYSAPFFDPRLSHNSATYSNGLRLVRFGLDRCWTTPEATSANCGNSAEASSPGSNILCDSFIRKHLTHGK